MTAPAGGSSPIELFISYSHKDEALREQLGDPSQPS